MRVEMPGQAPRGVGFNNVGGNYFLLMGTRVSWGGASTPTIGKAACRRWWFRGSLRGRCSVSGIRWANGSSPARRNGRWWGWRKMRHPTNCTRRPRLLYFAFAQKPADDITLMVETAGNPARLERAVRHELKQFDSRMTVYDSTTLGALMQFSTLQDRFMVVLSAGLGVCGFLLTAAGLFGVIQYAVNRRAREVGLRAALGAGPGQIERMVLGESVRYGRVGNRRRPAACWERWRGRRGRWCWASRR